MKFFNLLSTLAFFCAILSCSEEEIKQGSTDFSIAGYAQKGQFIKGSSITAYALNDKLQATGESFPSSIKDDLGSFIISSAVSAPYFELRAEGYYFVENTGEMSSAPIYLNALVKSSQDKVNINLLTTLTGGRIRKLISEGKAFETAKQQAESELISIFNFNSGDINIGFERMNISEGGTANAALLAASCLIQEGRNAGEVQKIISDISAEFEENGTISDRLREEILKESPDISIPDVVGNLISYYNKNGITDYTIPPFYTILNPEYAQGFHLVGPSDIVWGDIYDTDAEGCTEELNAVSYEDFTIESDVEWISADVSELCPHLYTLRITVAPNTDVEGREGHLYVKSKSGEVLYTDTTKQRGNGQIVYIEIDESLAGSRAQEAGSIINVNGKNYVLKQNPNRGGYYVELPKTDNGYGFSNMADRVVAGRNGDVLCATISYDSEVDEYIKQDDVIEFSRSTESKVPCYAALKAMPGYVLPNPAAVKLQPVCSLLTLQFKNKDSRNGIGFAKLRVEFGNDGFLSGEVTACMYPDQEWLDPSYTTPATEYRYKSNSMVVNNTNGDDKVSFLVHPQTISAIHCTACAADDSVLFEINQNIDAELRKGQSNILQFIVE